MWYGHTFAYSIVLYLTSLIWVMEILLELHTFINVSIKAIECNIKPLNIHCASSSTLGNYEYSQFADEDIDVQRNVESR